MLNWIRTKLDRKRAQTFLENIHAWYRTYIEVSEVMDEALHDQSIIKKDIGYIVENADRLLFHFRFYVPESLSTLRRCNPDLARRFDQASQKLFRLRNQTTSFLIRSQGPGPMIESNIDDETRIMYYYQALAEVGFTARDLRKSLDRELKFLWRDLQKIIVQEELVANVR